MKTDIRNYCRFIRNKLDVSLKIRARTLEWWNWWSCHDSRRL